MAYRLVCEIVQTQFSIIAPVNKNIEWQDKQKHFILK